MSEKNMMKVVLNKLNEIYINHTCPYFHHQTHQFDPNLSGAMTEISFSGYSVESGVFEENGTTLFVGGAPRSKMGLGQVML